MTDTESDRNFLKQLKKYEELIDKSSDEIIVTVREMIEEELQTRSDKQIKHHADMRRRLKNE